MVETLISTAARAGGQSVTSRRTDCQGPSARLAGSSAAPSGARPGSAARGGTAPPVSRLCVNANNSSMLGSRDVAARVAREELEARV